MRTALLHQEITDLQNNLYHKLNDFSKTNKNLGRFCSFPIAVLDVALDTLKTPLNGIEHVAMVAINLVGVFFSTKFTLKDALISTEVALELTVSIPVELITAPIKIIFQLFAIIINPEKVQSIDWRNATFKSTT